MSKKEKLIKRLKSKPKDFTFDEAQTLLKLFGYVKTKSGKTSGSSVGFIRHKKVFYIHKPHPRNELLVYQVNRILIELEREGLI